jgi:hypothetical protein
LKCRMLGNRAFKISKDCTICVLLLIISNVTYLECKLLRRPGLHISLLFLTSLSICQFHLLQILADYSSQIPAILLGSRAFLIGAGIFSKPKSTPSNPTTTAAFTSPPCISTSSSRDSSMDVGRPGPVVRAHRNMQPLTKQTTPVKVKKTVSVAVIFKKQPQKIKKQLATSHMPTENSRKTTHNSPDKKAQSLKSRSSSRTPQKAGWKVSRKRPGVHPLATEFKGPYTPK